MIFLDINIITFVIIDTGTMELAQDVVAVLIIVDYLKIRQAVCILEILMLKIKM